MEGTPVKQVTDSGADAFRHAMNTQLGRRLFGVAAIGFGVVAFVWHDFNVWQQPGPLGTLVNPQILLYLIAIAQICGGIAVQFERTARSGAALLGAVYGFFALMWLPSIPIPPHEYGHIGSFFEQFSLLAGAIIIYATAGAPSSQNATLARIGYIFFGLSVISFTLEQAFYLNDTAAFVPKWVPPGQMFWAVLTTIAFALAAIALLSGYSALLASRLLVIMIVGFELLIWIEAPFASPHTITAWDGNFENLGILASAWIVMDYLRNTARSQARAFGGKIAALN